MAGEQAMVVEKRNEKEAVQSDHDPKAREHGGFETLEENECGWR